MTTQTTNRSYEIGPSGVIFTSDVQQFLDADGNIIAKSTPMRTGYSPDMDPAKLVDPVVVAVAKQLWTPEVIAAYVALKTAS